LVGGKNFRAETGELSLSLLSSDGASYLFVQPDNSMASEVVTDLGWKMSSARSEASLVELDDHNRRTAATAQDQYWTKRHQTARDWVRSNPPPSVPGSTGNPLDAFLDARIQAALAASAGGMSPEGKLFHEKVLPVLRDNCFRCHGEKDKGGLRLNSREDALRPAKSGKLAIVPGKAAESEIISRLTTTDLDERMPPKGDGLKPDQIAAVQQWIKAGAPWPATPVSPQEVAKPALVSDAAFLRRAYLETVGIPAPETDAREFLADQRPDKRARLIDRLLADPRFADHW